MRRLGILARESPVWSIYHAYSGRSPNRKGKQDHEYTKSIERRRSSFPTPAADTPYPDEDLLSVQSYATPVCLTSQGRRGLLWAFRTRPRLHEPATTVLGREKPISSPSASFRGGDQRMHVRNPV